MTHIAAEQSEPLTSLNISDDEAATASRFMGIHLDSISYPGPVHR